MGLIEIPAKMIGQAIGQKIVDRNRMDGEMGPQNYAGFLKRFVAALIDGVVIGAIGGLVSMPFAGGDSAGLLYGANWFVTMLYFTLMESSEKQATLGKMVMGIQAADLEQNRLSFGKAFGRNFCKIFSLAICGVGYLLPLFTQKRQALHDLMSGCLVVNRDRVGA